MTTNVFQWLPASELKKKKQLDELRKQGKEPPLRDEDGNIINPYIPQYIAQVPWYLDNEEGHKSLKHQKKQSQEPEKSDLNKWYKRGAIKGPAATKYRPGACENCGAMTHKAKDCLERPRRRGAKLTGKDIKPDEVIQEIELDFEGKRDRWNGFEPDMYKEIIEKYKTIDMERRKLKAQQLEKKFMTEPDPNQKRFPHEGKNEDSDLDDMLDDSDKEDESHSTFATKSDPKTRTVIRNLRIREDTAKYLKDLDPNSPAIYDPKTRSMKYLTASNPEEDFTRSNMDDINNFAVAQKLSNEAMEKGQEIHLQAAPTQAQLLNRTFLERKAKLKAEQERMIKEKYGDGEQSEPLPKELIMGQSEQYVEYTRDGKILTDKKKAIPKSKYAEDIYIHNHTSVFGSYWEDGKWGYACCHQFEKDSFCTNDGSKEFKEKLEQQTKDNLEKLYKLAEEEAKRMLKKIQEMEEKKKLERKQKEEEEKKKKKKKKKDKKDKKHKKEKKDKKHKKKKHKKRHRESDSSDSSSESNSSEDESERKKVKIDPRAERKLQRYNSASKDTFEVTEKDMEEYIRKKHMEEDPMREWFEKEEAKKKRRK